MAFEDWKTNGASKIAQRWDNKKKNAYLTIFARNPIYPEGSRIADTTISAWTISIYNNNELIILKTFQTRPKAITFANKYMRSH